MNNRKALAAVIASLTVACAWAETETVGGYIWTYRINGDTVEIDNDWSCAISPEPTGALTIPATLGGKPVTQIGMYSFSGCSGLTSVAIPDSVTSIGNDAFSGCSGLTSVTIPDGVTSIGDWAFYGCSGLTSVTIPDSVTSIGESAFCECYDLASVAIPDSVTSIGDSAFFYCVGLTNVVIGSGVTSIGYGAFYNCSGLANVMIPDSVTSIGDSAFFYCDGLTNVVIGSGVTSIGYGAFYNCSGLANVMIPDSVTNIGEDAFYNCYELTSVVIGSGVTCIGAHAFRDCSSLTSLVIYGDNLKHIGDGAFRGCSALWRIVLPLSVAEIGKDAFYGISYRARITLPKSFAESCAPDVGNADVYYNDVVFLRDGHGNGLKCSVENGDAEVSDVLLADTATSLAIPSSMWGYRITSIGEEAFSGCSGLTSVTIPDSVTSIGYGAFEDCSSLKELVFPSSVTNFGFGVFMWCNSLRRVVVPKWCKTFYYLWEEYDGVALFGGPIKIGFVCWAFGFPNEDYYESPMMFRIHQKEIEKLITSRVKIVYEDVSGSTPTWPVTFDANGGTPKTQTVKQGSDGAFVLPAEPKRADHLFMGWWTAKDGGVRVTEDTVFLTGVYETLYAHWQLVDLGEPEIDDVTADGDGSFSMKLDDEWLVLSRLAVKGLPSGLKFDAKTGVISGKATKPGTYRVTVSATNTTLKKSATAEFEIVVPNLVSEKLPGLKAETCAYDVVTCGVAFPTNLVDCSPASGWAVKAAGLPAGLKFTAKDIVDSKTKAVTVPANTIYGVPTKAGTFTVTFTASKRGEQNQVATITLRVEALPAWAQGTFTGYVAGDGGDCGSATMTVAANGKVSGKIALGGTNWTFSATSYAAVECPQSNASKTNFVVEAAAKAGKTERAIELAVSSSAGGPAGTALVNGAATGGFVDGSASLAAWRNMWKDKSTATAAKAVIDPFIGVYTAAVADGADYGSGYLSLTVGKDGNVKATGKLADGTSVSATSPLMYDETEGWFVVLYAAPSAYKGGSFAAAVGFGERLTPLMFFVPQWTSRNPQATGEYGEGFARVVDLDGAYYNKLDTLRKYYESLRLGLNGAPELGFVLKETALNEQGKKTTASSAAAASAVDTLLHDDLTATVDATGKLIVAKATKPVQDRETKEWSYEGPNDGALTLSFTQATGIFKGSYTFWYDYESVKDYTTGKSTKAHTSKKVSFEGILVQGEDPKMDGFYLWDAAGEYEDEKTGKVKTYKYKQSFPVWLISE